VKQFLNEKISQKRLKNIEGFILTTMFTRIDDILIKIRLKVGKLFDMYKTYVEKTIYFLNAHVFGHLKAKKLQLKQIL
jgi:hypothetical protein